MSIRRFVVTVRSMCRFYVCYFCNFTACEQYFLLPREIIDNECPICESRNWYEGPISIDLEDCSCHIYCCGSCGGKLRHCSIESLARVCPWCSLYDRWIILPLGA